MISEPLHVAIGNSDLNKQRIAAVEKLFSFPPGKLLAPKRVLVGDGILWKHCRRKIKKRRFFLFSDTLLYGKPWPRGSSLNHPQFIDLADADVISVMDDGGFQKGFSVLSPKRSFTVYASTQEEANQWILHLVRCITEARLSAGRSKSELVSHSPVWIPDSQATHCMVCKTVEFSVLNRRHHCRHCGKVVCHKCSTNRVLLAYQSSERVRVCDQCFGTLSRPSPKLAEIPPSSVAAKTLPSPSSDTEKACTFYSGEGAHLSVPTDYKEQVTVDIHEVSINEDEDEEGRENEGSENEELLSSTDSECEDRGFHTE